MPTDLIIAEPRLSGTPEPGTLRHDPFILTTGFDHEDNYEYADLNRSIAEELGLAVAGAFAGDAEARCFTSAVAIAPSKRTAKDGPALWKGGRYPKASS